MLQKRPKKTSNVYSKENDPSISNIENMPNRINSGPSKNPNENKKSNSGNNYNIFENLKPGATNKRTKRQKDTKALAKSIIKENPKKSPPKDWDSLASSTELKEAEIKEIPIHAEKAVGYEMHFPTLGSEVPKVEKPEAAFSTDILSPNNVARHQLHMDTTTEASSLVLHDEKSERQASVGIEEEGTFQKTEEDLGEKEEKVAEYETHFPALGEKVEQPQAEYEFRKEILSPKHIGEIAKEIVEQANVVPEPVEWQNPLPKVQHEEITLERDQHVETDKMNHIEISDHEEPALEEEFDTKPIGLIYEELIPQMPLDSTAEDVEPEPAAFPEDAKSPLMRVELESTAFGTPTDLLNEKPVEFQEMLVSEIEQQDQASLVMNQDRDKEKVFEGREQREKQEEELEEYEMVWDSLSEEEEEEEVDHEGYKLIRQPLEYQEEKDLVNHRKEHEEEFGEYKTAPVSVLVREPGQERVKRSVLPPAAEVKIEPVVYAETKTGNEDLDELRSIEEDIVAGSDGEDDVKGKGPIIEDLTASRSTDLTLSACRIDLIREELRESDEINLNQNALFREIEKNLRIVEGLEQSNMYGAAINMLKKTLDALDTRLVRYHDTNVKEINRLEAECNVELAYCYSNLSDPRAAIEYARNALNLNSKDIKAFYVLGMSLIKCKDHMKGYSTLKEAKKLGPQPKYETYNELIDIEIRKYERKLEQVQEKAKADEEVKRSRPVIEERAIQQVKESNKIERKRSGGRAGSVACFVGTAMTSGLASWFITRNYMNMSEKKSWMYSIGIGALIGGLSLLVLGQVRKGN